MTELDTALLAAIADQSDDRDATIAFITEHPEPAHAEHLASAHLADRLGAAGFRVERGIAGMPTAFRAEIDGAGPGRTVGVIAVYDAVSAQLPDGTTAPIHSCGHGPQSAGVVGAALALAAQREHWDGRLVVVGCPADEIHSPGTREHGSGKGATARAGVWDDIDVALYPHPEFFDTIWTASLWMRRETAVISGGRTLRADTDPAPIAALRELAALSADSDPGRVMIETAVLDGDVEEGAGLTMTIRLLLFAETEAELESSSAAVRARFAGAEWTAGAAISAIRYDADVAATVADAFRAAGRDPVLDPEPLPFATDFGDVTQRVPAALVGVGRDGGWGFHTDRGAHEFAGDDGRRIASDIAGVIALAVPRLSRRAD
ncbi:M20/M25/M40 family metallo-hydrolase [Schumannella soli]|uniref:M20 family metallopeptidase n=1 Tax=Schumannella soli TaxID=2590779 RepID=A0A506Y4A5_9MICO|nr:M20/M25/M40 family metallo-hydrolase [Schumannella soli]TPW77426.1 M20 family metallopeptidase [Schumannella soli]